MSKERRKQINDLRAKMRALQNEAYAIGDQVQKLELEEARERYVCTCVRLNGDIAIFDSATQERAGRRGLQIGMVSETLSALKACPLCHGRGIPIAMQDKEDGD